MTPPKPVDSAKPAPAPVPDKPADKPADPVKADAKVEVKADGDAKPSFFADPSSYSVKLDFGYGGQDFSNGQGVDHNGFRFKAAAGLVFRLADDKVRIPLRLFYGYQGLNKDLGQGVESTATQHSFGVESGVGYAFHPNWFSAYGMLGLGAGYFSAPESRDGMKGAEFQKNPLLFPLSSAGFLFNLGAELCTWSDAVCVNGGYTKTFGVNPTLDVVDGPSGSQGLNPGGFYFGAGVDVMRIVDNIRGGGVAKPRGKVTEEPAKKADEAPKPVDAGKPGEAPKPGDAGKPGAPAEPALTGAALFEKRRDENKTYAERAKKAADGAKSDLDIVKLASTDADKAKAMATDSVSQFRTALEAMNNANTVVADLEQKLPGLTGDDKTKAEAALKDARASADAANKSARDAWDSASAASKAYDKKKAKDAPSIDFPDTKPAAQGAVPKKPTGTYVPPKKDNPPPPPKKDNPPPPPKKDNPPPPPKKDNPGGTQPEF